MKNILMTGADGFVGPHPTEVPVAIPRFRGATGPCGQGDVGAHIPVTIKAGPAPFPQTIHDVEFAP